MSTQDNIGKIVGADARRDAIHVAVEPVTAAGKLYPTDRLALCADDPSKVFACDDDRTVGIVDPFLTRPVREGERFYMFLLPNTITSLRHVWTHPAFGEPRSPKETSEQWLRDWCEANEKHGIDSYEETVALALAGPEDGDDYLLVRMRDVHCEIPEEFWRHIETVTGREIPAPRRAKNFSCAC